jgi:hypothetical protein
MIVSFTIQWTYGYPFGLTLYVPGTLVFTVLDNVNIVDANLYYREEDSEVGLSIEAFHDDWYWENTTTTTQSIDLRDRVYVPIDLLVNWNHPYIINYTTIRGESVWNFVNNVTLTYNDLWDGVTLYGQEGNWTLSFVGITPYWTLSFVGITP